MKAIVQVTILFGLLILVSCANKPKFSDTVPAVDLQKFMGKWYVMAGRFTPFEKDVYNGIETYEFDKENEKIKIGFTYNQGSFDGPVKNLPQTGWVYNKNTNSHWKVSPLWPFKFDYLIIGLSNDYSWTVIGVPDESYVWIMSRSPKMEKSELDKIIETMKAKKYNMDNLVFVSHQN